MYSMFDMLAVYTNFGLILFFLKLLRTSKAFIALYKQIHVKFITVIYRSYKLTNICPSYINMPLL